MKIPRFIACLTALLCMAAGCRSEDDAAVRALARRIIPEHEKQFRFERLTDTTECFELESRGSKIVVRGNSSASIAVGLNHYLKNYCLTTVSWHACNPVEMPAVLPRIDEKVRVESRARERFFLNYCTFGYTMPWWGWTEWERFIDWMALQGVTMPLAITGQEAVWQRVWTRLGLSDEEVRAYFTGPAHLPWHRMSNIDRWQGPLPEEWIDGQLALQQRILARERELGMKPVLPAFAGHVPQELKRLHPDARITRVSYWGGFDDRYRCSFLDPMDPLFAVIQREFLTEQTRLFGTGHIYGADPFNEIDAPTWDPETLAGMSRHIYESMAEVDPPDGLALLCRSDALDRGEHPRLPRRRAAGPAADAGLLLRIHRDLEADRKIPRPALLVVLPRQFRGQHDAIGQFPYRECPHGGRFRPWRRQPARRGLDARRLRR